MKIDYENCMDDKCKIIRKLYNCIYANNTEQVRCLLKNYDWLKDILQTSWIADMQFYAFDKNTREYNLYFPNPDLLDLLESFGVDIKKSLNYPIIYSAEIQDNADYMSSSMQNKNAITRKYKVYKNVRGENQTTFLKIAEETGRLKYYSKWRTDSANKDDDKDTQLTQKEYRDLQTVGKSWFVSRMYHDFIDRSHNNWELTPNGFKMGTFKKITRDTQKKYLQNILKSNTIMLSKNAIGLSGAKIKEMANELLDNWDDVVNQKKSVLDTSKNTNKTKSFSSSTFSEQATDQKTGNATYPQGPNSTELTPKEERDLQTMGRSWFVSRMYHDFIDRSHNNWELTPTGFKMGTFQKITRITQKKYLQNILKSNVTMLGKNQIGLSGTEVLRMAQELLDRLKEVSV